MELLPVPEAAVEGDRLEPLAQVGLALQHQRQHPDPVVDVDPVDGPGDGDAAHRAEQQPHLPAPHRGGDLRRVPVVAMVGPLVARHVGHRTAPAHPKLGGGLAIRAVDHGVDSPGKVASLGQELHHCVEGPRDRAQGDLHQGVDHDLPGERPADLG